MDRGLVSAAVAFHPWDAMDPAALTAIVERGEFSATAETGCGGSTIVLSQVSAYHTAFAIAGEHRTISALSQHPHLAREHVVFVEGLTRETVPVHQFAQELDLVLLDGPHGYPLPQIEYAYLFPHIRKGGWLVIDDLEIPSVYELFCFLRREPGVELDEVVGRTAFFRKTAGVDGGPDGWWLQGINRRLVLRYSWRDRLHSYRKALFGSNRLARRAGT